MIGNSDDLMTSWLLVVAVVQPVFCCGRTSKSKIFKKKTHLHFFEDVGARLLSFEVTKPIVWSDVL